MKEINIPMSFSECGLNEDEYMANIDEISEKAFEDQCTTANPKLPLIEELKDILKKAY